MAEGRRAVARPEPARRSRTDTAEGAPAGERAPGTVGGAAGTAGPVPAGQARTRRGGRPGRISAWLADLDPGTFAAVMATGIVSIAAGLLGYERLSQALFWVAAVAFVILAAAYLVRAVRFRDLFLQSLRRPHLAVSYFTVVAGSDVLAIALAGRGLQGAALALGVFALVCWFLLTYGLFASIVLAGNHPQLRQINGIWLVWVVGTQSVAVLAAALAARAGPAAEGAGLLAVVFWSIGIVLYLVLVVIIFLRLLLIETTPQEMGPAYWILMGATAISVRAATGILALADPSPLVAGMRPFLFGAAVVLWSFGTWFIPMLVLFGLWRYFVRGHPWRYEAKLWSVVFPLGMYTVASESLGTVAGNGFLTVLAGTWVWIGVGAWAVVAALFAAALLRRPVPPAGAGSRPRP